MKNIVAHKGYIQQDQKSWIDKCLGSLSKINPLLRPQKQSTTLIQYLQKFQQVSLYTDPYYGQCYLLQCLSIDQLRILRKQKHNQINSNTRLQTIQEISNFNNNFNVINQQLICKVQKKGFLWTNVQLYLAYDYIIVDLQKQFQNRITQGNRFSQSQLMTIILGATKGYVHLQSTEYNSINMKNIYFCQKEVRVAHPKLFNYKSNLSSICDNQQQKGIYLAPQELDSLSKGEKHINYGWRANSFTFGMVILALMNMHHLAELYNYSACTIAFKKMKQLISYVRTLYSQKLVNIVQSLLRQKVQERITFRSLLNRLTQRRQYENKNIQITLIQQKIDIQQQPGKYRPIQLQQPSTQNNYLAGLIYPKVGMAGQYISSMHQRNSFLNNFQNKNLSSNNIDDGSVIADQRYYYSNRNSYYVGGGYSYSKNNNNNANSMKEQPIRQGKGIYHYQNGQLYQGQWHKGQMHGFGKLYWNQHKLRYQGQFINGKFHGKGIQYPQTFKQDDQIDYTFVRLQNNNWMKYEGNYKNDKRQGQGIAYFGKCKWIGNFKNGQCNGQGIFYDKNGQKTKGIYKDGILLQ